jgi:ketosteroid isomerase-like protein
VRQCYAISGDGKALAAAARGASGFEDLWELIDPEVELLPAVQSPLAGGYHGHEGVRRFFSEVFEIWDEEDFRREPESLEPVDDRILAIVRVHARFKGTGIALDERWADVWTVRDGKVERLEVFRNPDEARRALS